MKVINVGTHALVVALIIVFITPSIDVVMPSLPLIKSFFHVSEAISQGFISAYILGNAVFALIIGGLSDKYGRRPVMLGTLVVFTVSSVASAMIHNVYLLLICRFFHGSGSAAAWTIGIASIYDIVKFEKAAKIISRITIAALISYGSAPFLGACIAKYFHWESVFTFMSASGFIILTLVYTKFEETHHNTTALTLKENISLFASLCKNRLYLSSMIIHALSINIMWILLANSPFMLIQHMHVSEVHFSLISMFMSIFSIAGGYINQKYVINHGIDSMMKLGIALIICTFVLLGIFHILNFMIPITFMISTAPLEIGVTIVISNSKILFLDAVQDNLGSGNAIAETTHMMTSSIFIFGISKIFHGAILPIILTSFMLSLILGIIYIRYISATAKQHNHQ